MLRKARSPKPVATAVSVAVAAIMIASLGACSSERPSSASPVETDALEPERYAVIGQFDGSIAVFGDDTGVTEVDDRFEIVFEWDRANERLIGEPIIANFASRLVELAPISPDCEAPVRTTPFDLAEVVAVDIESGPIVNLTYVTLLSGGLVPIDCSGDTRTIDSNRSETQLALAVPSNALDKSGGAPVSIEANGWTVSFTRSRPGAL